MRFAEGCGSVVAASLKETAGKTKHTLSPIKNMNEMKRFIVFTSLFLIYRFYQFINFRNINQEKSQGYLVFNIFDVFLL